MYVLGELSTAEVLEVEKMAQEHSIVRDEILAIQEALSQYAVQFKMTPPPKEDIYNAILAAEEKERQRIRKEVIGNERNEENDVNKTHIAPVVPIVPLNTQSRYLAMASIVLLILSGIGNIYLYQKYQDAEAEIVVLNGNKESLTQEVNTKGEAYQKAEATLVAITNVQTKSISLKGLPNTPDYTAIVYWNDKTGEVYMNPIQLKMPPEGKQYQLWAIVNGKPVDMGMLSNIERNAAAIQKMKTVNTPQAFAITLEKTGGNPAPTMEAMVVMGSI